MSECYKPRAEPRIGRASAADALRARFREERDADYEALARAIREWIRKAQRRSGRNPPEDELPVQLVRLRKRFDEIARLDFCDAAKRRDAARLIRNLERQLRSGPGTESRG